MRSAETILDIIREYGVRIAGERLDVERVTSRLEGSGWKSTRKGNSLAAYPTRINLRYGTVKHCKSPPRGLISLQIGSSLGRTGAKFAHERVAWHGMMG